MTNSVPTIQRWYQRNRYPQINGGESRTDTSFGNDTDINKIVERFARTGTLPEGPSVQPHFGDVTEMQGDLTELLQKSETGRKALAELQAQQAADQEARLAKDAKELEEFRKQKAALAATEQEGEST
ncbi:internal scaffolding protein [Microviridae sp.]|nr:internal scaffolding protein [Microviridae sp.]